MIDWTYVLAAFCFGYPFVMAFYWITGGLLYLFLRERSEPPPDTPPDLLEYPSVSILVPCFNEEKQIAETFSALSKTDYPNFEIIAINDGSADRTGPLLDEISDRIPNMRVVHLASNQGKSTALNMGALVSKGEFIVGIDGDALLDPLAVRWLVRRFQTDPTIGALTGNPRIRNRSSLLGRLQVGEYSTIVGLIKRAQTVYGVLFTISGVICAFRKRALYDAGWWNKDVITEDVDISWRIQLSGWRIAYEPKAICWILMPETLRGLWRQRLRWTEGGTRTVIDMAPRLFERGNQRLWPVWINYVVSIAWAYVMLLTIGVWAISLLGIGTGLAIPAISPIPNLWGTVLVLTYLLQAVTSISLDSRYEKGIYRSIFWIIWYPLIYWVLQATTAIVGLPKALLSEKRGTWKSPDRGIGNV